MSQYVDGSPGKNDHGDGDRNPVRIGGFKASLRIHVWYIYLHIPQCFESMIAPFSRKGGDMGDMGYVFFTWRVTYHL